MKLDYTNMLIIGNGFDLAHKRPTSYSDFLLFLELIIKIRDCKKGRKYVEKYLHRCDKLGPAVKEYLLSSLDTRLRTGTGYARNRNKMVQELYDCLSKNVWYEYFQLIHKAGEIRGKNWIDFEREIREIIEFFDHKITDIYEQWDRALVPRRMVPPKIDRFSRRLDFSKYNKE